MLGMVEYSAALNEWMPAMFPSEEIVNTLGAWVAGKGLRQFRLAETEKYPHVTFFINGGVETPAKGEDRHMAPSPKVRTYDLQPEMSAAEVTESLVGAIRSGDYDLIVVNYANPDMVGHTGVLEAAIKAVETVDSGLGEVIAALAEVGGAMIVTADHGNCEVMIDPETGGPHTAHTLNPVPVVLVGGPAGARLHDGRLADLAPTPPRADGPRPAARDARQEPDRGRMTRAAVLLLAVALAGQAPARAATEADAVAAASAGIAEAGKGLDAARAARRTGSSRSAGPSPPMRPPSPRCGRAWPRRGPASRRWRSRSATAASRSAACSARSRR